MPSLGTHANPPSVVLGSSGEGKGSPDGKQERSFQDRAVAKDDTGKQRAHTPEEESYMSSTKMAYVSGEMQPQTIPMYSHEGRNLASIFPHRELSIYIHIERGKHATIVGWT